MVVFSKTTSSTPYFLHVENTLAQVGSDLEVYPTRFNKYYLVAYGIVGETMDLDPNKTYDYHTAFDIQLTKVVYNVDLNMNWRKILNIALDKNSSNSAATVKLVTDLEAKLGPFTKNVYWEIFEEFYDFGDASNYKLTIGASGITFTGINPNITFPQKNIIHVQEGGLRLQNQTLDLSLFSKMNFTIRVVMQLWLNRSMSIKTIIDTGIYERPHLIYEHTTKSLKLQTTGYDETSITLLNSFSGKRVVFWLTKKTRGPSVVITLIRPKQKKRFGRSKSRINITTIDIGDIKRHTNTLRN